MITLPLPPALNTMYRYGNGKYYKSQESKDYEETVHWMLKKHKFDKDKEVSLELHFYFKRDRDIDSCLKCLLDSLEGVVYNNDKQVKELHVYKFRGEPRLELDIINY